MDRLDQLAEAARDLLDRVDNALLAGGAPADHPVWPLLRAVGALPGDLLAHLLDADPPPVRELAEPLRRAATGLAEGRDDLPGPVGWRGAAAEAYSDRWKALGGYLADPPDSIVDRLRGTVAYAEEVAGWLVGTRDALAAALAECLGSVEAVVLRSPPVTAARQAAAATIAARVLRAAVTSAADGRALRERWAGRLAELPYRPEMSSGPGRPGHLTVGY